MPICHLVSPKVSQIIPRRLERGPVLAQVEPVGATDVFEKIGLRFVERDQVLEAESVVH